MLPRPAACRPCRFACTSDITASFALQAELRIQRDRIGSRDIIALRPESSGLYVAADVVVGSRGNSKAPVEHQTTKNRGDGMSFLGMCTLLVVQ